MSYVQNQQPVPMLPVIPVAPACMMPPAQQIPASPIPADGQSSLGPTLLEVGCRLLIALAQTRLR